MNSRFALTAGATLVLALAMTGQSATAGAGSATSPKRVAAAAPTPNGSWTVYHHDNAHTGYDATQPAATGGTVGWTSPTLDGSVYGEPLVYGGLVYVSTLNNSVYALDQSTGAVVWTKNVGAPQASGWQCGNINPTGMLGTGVIDTAASRFYVVGFLHQFLSYYLFGFDLATGTRVLSTQIAPAGFDWTDQQQRGALALSKDGTHVYVPFGGRAGDCGAYHGWIVGVPASGGVPNEQYMTPSTGEGLWNAGGVVVDDSTGHVFEATGNAMPNTLCTTGPGGASQSDSVIETNAVLGGLSTFQPQDWATNWCGPDSDLGSASPVLLNPSLMFMSGKHGQGFLLNPTALGGTDGQLFPTKKPSTYVGADVCVGNQSDATFGSFAYAAPRVYIECEGHGIVSLTINTGTPSFSTCDSTCTATGTWETADGSTFGPPIVAGGAVWAIDTNGGGLSGFDASTGAVIYQSAGFVARRFETPSEAGGQIFVGSDTVVRSFNITSNAAVPCSGMNATASPPSSAQVGSPLTITATATGCANPNYEFWMQPPGGTWSVVQRYSPSPTLSLDTTPMPPGSYRFSVWARDMGSSGTNGTPPDTYDAFSAFNYTLSSPGCATMTAAAAPPTSTTAGTPVIVSGSATGCANPLYEFWIRTPGGAWSVARPYSSTATFNWVTAGKAAGMYRLSVWARDIASGGSAGTPPNTYDSFSAFDYTLTTAACTGMIATVSPPTSANVGTQVTVSGSATGCPNPRYEFWLLPPGGTWAIAQGYSGASSFTWSTIGKRAGSYRFSVWARDASSLASYDAFSAFDYPLTTAPCTGIGASTNPVNTASRGTDVTVTGAATGCPNPRFEIWLLPPSGTWTLLRGWTSSPSTVWHTTAGTAAGTYRFSVWARDLSSAGTSGTVPNKYDSFSAFPYSLS